MNSDLPTFAEYFQTAISHPGIVCTSIVIQYRKIILQFGRVRSIDSGFNEGFNHARQISSRRFMNTCSSLLPQSRPETMTGILDRWLTKQFQRTHVPF